MIVWWWGAVVMLVLHLAYGKDFARTTRAPQRTPARQPAATPGTQRVEKEKRKRSPQLFTAGADERRILTCLPVEAYTGLSAGTGW